MPLGSTDTVVAPSYSLPSGVRRVRLRGPAVVGAVLLGVAALVILRFVREEEVPSPAPAEAMAVAVAPAAKPVASPPAPPLPTPALPTSLAPAALAPAPSPGPGPRALVDVEPRKVLASSGRHLVTPEPAPTMASPPPMPRASLADTAAILTRGQTAFDRGDYQEAIRQGRQAIAGGAEINGRLLVGDVYFYLERYREALREYNAAVARDPSDTSARKRRDLAREKAGQAAQGDAP
jgi:hypothetical protein